MMCYQTYMVFCISRRDIFRKSNGQDSYFANCYTARVSLLLIVTQNSDREAEDGTMTAFHEMHNEIFPFVRGNDLI